MEKLIHWVRSAWGRWITIYSWIKTNAGPIIAIVVVMNLFGMIEPEFATSLRDAVLAMAGL